MEKINREKGKVKRERGLVSRNEGFCTCGIERNK
jgi:hypothetical protein